MAPASGCRGKIPGWFRRSVDLVHQRRVSSIGTWPYLLSQALIAVPKAVDRGDLVVMEKHFTRP